MTNLSEKYGDLAEEKEVVENIEAFEASVSEVHDLLETLIKADLYEKLSIEDKIKHDLFLSYSLTSLYWMYSRTKGEDPFSGIVKTETDRVQDYMKKFDRIKDRKSAPKLDVNATKRFVKSGLYDPKNKPQPSNKRKTFNDD